MTKRIYYQENTKTDFDARIIAIQTTDDGWIVQLNQSAFYPTSGGQPHDTGTINGIPVTNVWEDQDGEIWHLLETDPGEIHIVRGSIDWPRRFDHMQQHSGQHLLSAVCAEKFGANTIGFHIGSVTNTIDLNIENLTDDEINLIETEANNLVWENKPVSIRYVRGEEINQLPIRKKPKVTGEVRVIEIHQVDFSACGGTHVSSTGEIGLIKIVGKEKYKQGVRLEFLCGGRALQHYQENLATLYRISADLSIHPSELPAAVNRFRKEIVDSHRKIKEIQKAYLPYEAENIWQMASKTGGLRRIHAHWVGRDYDDIRIIADLLRQHEKTVLLLALTEKDKVRLICTRSNNLVDFDSAWVLKQALDLLGGRGGGSAEYAQGGAPISDNQSVSDILKFVIEKA